MHGLCEVYDQRPRRYGYTLPSRASIVERRTAGPDSCPAVGLSFGGLVKDKPTAGQGCHKAARVVQWAPAAAAKSYATRDVAVEGAEPGDAVSVGLGALGDAAALLSANVAAEGRVHVLLHRSSSKSRSPYTIAM